jgi:ubiquinone/menaquinone biosynthesis C-methylase UbiE
MLTDTIFFTNFSRLFYNYFYSIKQLNHLRTNNFGYAPVDKEIATYQADLQYGLQLYKELLQANSRCFIDYNTVVAEVSCGKGGGAEYVIKKFMPQKYTGVDFSRSAIEFCKKNYATLQNAEFICADASKLPFPDNSMDIVINIEASHLYRNPSLFFREVKRVLKTNGYFLFADYRQIKTYSIEKLELEISSSGLTIVERREVTTSIYNACVLASKRREEIVQKVIPGFLQKYFRHYAILEGTKKFVMLGNGEFIYMMYHIKK